MNEPVGPLVDLRDTRVLAAKWSVDCGRRVSDRRNELGWSRTSLAARIGSTEPTLIRIEHGSLNPRDHVKFALAAVLGVEVDTLWAYPRIAEVLGTPLDKTAA